MGRSRAGVSQSGRRHLERKRGIRQPAIELGLGTSLSCCSWFLRISFQGETLMASASTVESFQFQAETTQLLNLMIHSLYTQREIFLRELISNASDALDRLRFEALTNTSLIPEGHQYEIRLKPDLSARTLTISDTGIGMSRQDLIDHIGTIARSGTRELRKRMKESQSAETTAELIGQFGVGFYSAFMVAEKVSIVTRRAGETATIRWESTGDGSYTL